MPTLTVRSAERAPGRSALRSLARLWPWVRPVRRDNIALGCPGVSRSDIEGAATAVGAQAGRTALIVAHRPSTIRIADRVLVTSGGHIVEDGTPDQLFGTRTAKSPGRCRPGSSKS